jgi:hypothetical protein
MVSEIVKVRGESNSQKRITVPADSDIKPGDYVMIEKVEGVTDD